VIQFTILTAWYSPPPPHQPHVRSIDFLSGIAGSVLLGVDGGLSLGSTRGVRGVAGFIVYGFEAEVSNIL